jgi:hypothetical protein
MKTYKIFSLFAFLAFALLSCKKNDIEFNKGNTALKISVSNNQIILDKNNPQTIALSIDWTTGSNFGTNSAINYTLQIDKKGNNFANGITIDMGRNIYQKAYKNEELNALLINEFEIGANEETILECRVTAATASDLPEEISPIETLSIKTHTPITSTLYLIGDATPNGWDANNATELQAISNTPKGFSWTGRLTAGKFKFITTLGNFAPSYNKGDTDHALYFRSSDADPYDEQFEITEGGSYKINVNLITLAISIEKSAGPEYERLWIVGNPTGWSFTEMRVDPLDPFVFHYNGDLSAGGEIKFGTVEGNFSATFLRPKVDQTSEGSDLEVDKWAGDPDYKWNITGGIYKISIDTREMKANIRPFTPYSAIYMVGDATSKDWDIDNATPMTASGTPYEFTWTGILKAGDFKFTLDKQNDWNGAWFTASKADMEPSGSPQQMIFSKRGSGLDYKWKIRTGGTYTVTLNQLNETVVILKQ